MTKKRFTLIGGIDENPYEWDLMDNEFDCLILQSNGISICSLLNELAEENKQLKEDVNELENKIARLKFSKKMMKENIKDYERSIKRLRRSFEEFDEMRLNRIRFLENRLKKNRLSIYVNEGGELND